MLENETEITEVPIAASRIHKARVQQRTERIMVYGSPNDCESVRMPQGSEPFTTVYAKTNGIYLKE